jgi:phosphoadenosine phosphosulfate reductase
MAFAIDDNEFDVPALAVDLERAPLAEVLCWCWEHFGAKAAIGTSFQGAGLVIIDHAVKAGLPFPIFTLDTGLLFPETLELKQRLEAHFGITIEGLRPDRTVEQQAEDEGAELWKRSPDLCCHLRKVVPLQRKLETLDVWITGVRRAQAETRERTQILELYKFDPLRELCIMKLNPLAMWGADAVRQYIKAHGIPNNPLYDRGFRSIGCMPCTRPVLEGQNERAGRWTGFDKTECGIHTFLGKAMAK